MHYWQKPWYKDNILSYFKILNYKGEIVESEVIEQVGKFYLGKLFFHKMVLFTPLAVIVARLKRNMVVNQLTIDDILQDVSTYKAAYYNVLSFKYQINHVGELDVRPQKYLKF